MLRRPIPTLLAYVVALPLLACEGALVATPPDAGAPIPEDASTRPPRDDAGDDEDAAVPVPDAGLDDAGPRPPADGRIARFETSLLTRGEPGASGEIVALVANRAGVARDDVVTVSLPLARGRVPDLAGWALADDDTGEALETSWQPIRQWPDGSAQTAVARVRLAVDAGATRRLALVPATQRTPTAHTVHPCVAGPLALTSGDAPSMALLAASVTDKLGIRYTIDSRALAADDEVELVHVDPYQATYRVDAYFHSDDPGALTRDGAARDFLHALVYVRVPSALSPPVVGVDFVLGNDYLGWGNPSAGWGHGSVSATPPSDARTFFPLGDVHVREATLTLRGGLDAVSFLEAANGFTRADDASGTTFVLDRDFFFGDHQRLMSHHRVAFACDDWDDARRDALRTELRASVEHALVGVATREAYAASDALTVVGTLDLANVPADVAARAASELDGWPAASGDAWDSYGQSRSPNNGGGSPLMGAISTPYLRLVLSQDPRYARMLRQHAMNLMKWPGWMHGVTEHVGETDFMWQKGVHFASRNQMGRPRAGQWSTTALYPDRAPDTLPRNPNGYTGNDVQHWTINPLVDHFASTGERWAWDAIRESAALLTRALPNGGYATAPVGGNRNERETGWTFYAMAQAIALGADADEDRPLLAWLRTRTDLIARAWRANPFEGGSAPPVFTAHDPDARSGFVADGRDYRMSTTWMLGIAALGAVAAHPYVPEVRDAILTPALEGLADGYEHRFTDPITGAYHEHGLRYFTMTHLDEGAGLARVRPEVGDALNPTSGAALSLGSTRRFGFTGITAAMALYAEGDVERTIAQCVGSALYDRGAGTSEHTAWERLDLVGAGFAYDTSGCDEVIAYRDARYE